jgi:DNA invertase Pin-like site-specific DNA recombinase
MLSMEAIIYCALRNATGRLLFNRLGAIAQFETDIPAERQMDGIQKAKERGALFDEIALKLGKGSEDMECKPGQTHDHKNQRVTVKVSHHIYLVTNLSY